MNETRSAAIAASGNSQRFGNAELDREFRELRIDGQRVSLGPRAYALLAMLVDERQRPVSKHELLETVWQGVIVEENNLQVQISSLRRLLGPQAIATIPGRGYRFMLPVEGDEAGSRSAARNSDAEAATRDPTLRGNLPARLPDLYGRADESLAVSELLARHSLVSIIGPSGIGKTRLAISVAHALAARSDTVWVVELASLMDPQLLAPIVAQSLQISLPGLREPEPELIAAVHDLRALIVIDNCEHLIEQVGALLVRLLASAPSIRVLATSQEPLHVDGEHVYRLGPLAVPEHADGEATTYGAVQLFVERVRALLPGYRPGELDRAAAIEICRRLDGLPLAIELAAARVPVLGVAGVRDRLGERFRLLTGGSRVAPRRHQTLHAALDWSQSLLADDERAVYRRLGTFVGSFALESAQELATDEDIDSWAVLEHLSSLVDKSLVIAEGEPRPRYRMLESTREHALEQLAAAGETERWIARHAEVTIRAVDRAIRQRRTDLVMAETANVRSAYEWARQAGDRPAMVALATLPSMVIAVDGAVREASQRLLEVEALIDEATLPRKLVAQYWQWYGRIGVGGRLPTERCIEAFRRAERLFGELGNERHVHACRRQLAEALLDAGELDAAADALKRAREMEDDHWPLADRMRRLRVEGLWHAECGRSEEALQTSSLALDMAQLAKIDRYELVLLDDIARIHLEHGQADEAAQRYAVLAERARGEPNAGLTLSNALAGLVAALTAKNDLAEADRAAREALPVLRRSGILLARADVLAGLMARQGRFELAAQLLGASDRFRSEVGTPRGPVEQACREEALLRLSNAVGAKRRAAWLAVGAVASEESLVAQILAQSQ